MVARAWDEKRIKTKWLTEEFMYPLGRKGNGPTPEPKEKRLGVYGNKYAIVIGVSDYENLKTKKETPEAQLADLDYAHLDALAFSSMLSLSHHPSTFYLRYWIFYIQNTYSLFSNLTNPVLTLLLKMPPVDSIVYVFSFVNKCK